MKRFALALLVLLLCAPLPPASAQAPSAQGWWSVLNRQGLPALPAPPDVGPDDLLVQGGDLLAAVPGQPQGQPQPTAVAALTFAVDPGSTVTSLDLPVKGQALAMDVRAYAAAEPFVPAQNGSYELAPDVVLTDLARGVLSADGTSLGFTEISRLVRPDGVLSIVLVAGLSDRVVLSPPGDKALSVVPAREPEQPTPPPLPPVFVPPVTPPVTAPPFSPLAPITGPVAPVVQTPQVPVPQAAAPELRRRAQTTDDTTTRLLALAEALLVGISFGLLGYGPFGRLSRWTGLATEPRGALVVRGVGRFRAVRTGPAPRL